MLGIVVAAIWPRPGPDDADEEQDSESSDAWATPEYEALPSTANRYGSDGGVASRRIADDCDPVAESMKYEGFIGTRARAILSWNEISAATADLKIPVDVVDIEDGTVDGQSLTWKASITSPMAMTLEFSATVDGDEMKGDVKLGAFGNADFTGTRA